VQALHRSWHARQAGRRLKADEKALAQRLQREGTWRHLWRIAGLYASVSIFDVPDAQALHDTLMQLPMVRDVNGQPLAGVIVDVWHANTGGTYSYFDPSQSEFNLPRRIVTDHEGRYRFQSIVPSGYGCPPAAEERRERVRALEA